MFRPLRPALCPRFARWRGDRVRAGSHRVIVLDEPGVQARLDW
ncbi:MAG TPA: hypothetical protein VIS29_16875 [Streptomyces sp.]